MTNNRIARTYPERSRDWPCDIAATSPRGRCQILRNGNVSKDKEERTNTRKVPFRTPEGDFSYWRQRT